MKRIKAAGRRDSMRKVAMLLPGAAIASMAYGAVSAARKLPALAFLIIFVSGQFCMDAGGSSAAGYECCMAADAEYTALPEEYYKYCREIGRKYNICPELLMAMIERESNGDAAASNNAGDTGLLQVNPRWHRGRMERLGVTDLYDPYANILVAADYLAELFQKDSDLYLVLMEYNMGPDKAVSLYSRGIYSEYAVRVSERAYELERLHEKEGGGRDG